MLGIPLLVIFGFHVGFMLITAVGVGLGRVDACGDNLPLWICVGPFAGALEALEGGQSILGALAGGFNLPFTLWGLISMDYAILRQGGFVGNFTALLRVGLGLATLATIVFALISIVGNRRFL